MKKLLLILCLLLAFVSCNEAEEVKEEKKDNKTENVGGIDILTEDKKEEEKPEEFYSAVVTTGYSSWRTTYAMMDNGDMEKLSERTIYGNPTITDDGKHILYRHTEYDDTIQDYVERLFVKDNKGNRTILVTDPGRMAIDTDGNFAVAEGGDGVYYISDFANPNPVRVGDSIGAYNGMYANVATGALDKSAAFITDEGKVCYVDPDTLEVKIIAENGVRLLKRVSKDCLFYITSEGLCFWNGKESNVVNSEYKINKNCDWLLSAGEWYYYLADNGRLIDITEAKGSTMCLSESENYLVSINSDKLSLYSLSQSGAKLEAEFEGKYHDAKVYDDGFIIASKVENSTKRFGFIKNGEYKELAETLVFMDGAEYVDNKVYFVCSDDSRRFMRYNVETDVLELVKEDISNFVITRDNKCFYITDVDSNGCGNLWTDTSTELIEDNVLEMR